MRTTMTLSANTNCSPFEIFNQDTDEVIMLINFYIEIGDEKPQEEAVNNKKEISRKNDGFWDM